MSKSLGNIVPLHPAIKEHGADAIRIATLISAELLQDADFNFDALEGIKSKLIDVYHMTIESLTSKMVIQMKNEKSNELEDRWLDSRLQKAIAEITVCLDKLRMREALHILLYSLDQDLQWHKKRAYAKRRQNTSTSPCVLRFLNARIRMLSPFAPFISEDVWEKIGNSTSIIFGGWPVVDASKLDQVAEEAEHLVINLISDIQTIIKVTKIKPSNIIIYVSRTMENFDLSKNYKKHSS